MDCYIITVQIQSLYRRISWIGLEQRQQEPGNDREYRQLMAGDVALLKGEGWFGNEGCGVVHRSPGVTGGGGRLFLSLDPLD